MQKPGPGIDRRVRDIGFNDGPFRVQVELLAVFVISADAVTAPAPGFQKIRPIDERFRRERRFGRSFFARNDRDRFLAGPVLRNRLKGDLPGGSSGV